MTFRHLLVAASAALAALVAPAAALAGVAVNMDESRRVTLSAPAASVVVANPSIVDVSLIDSRNLLLLGRGYGATNVLVTDRLGRTIYNSVVTVTAGDDGRVSVYRAGQVANFTCSSRCERTPMPGEIATVFDPYNTGYATYAGRARGAAASTQTTTPAN